ncbi:Uncharacterised protein [Legionella busanensis]|uniref:Uncharacterized protein n=1 Tax=Legionella busanensis TaxID=190655 RepID=A0A378KAY4_9GAMM|nr:hypothetical protein [Legionella busanensis]STX81669.1 Uncharacterised protein [Legionella busanensis]STX81728.1 Uncharacterised protein [Legionella busanensis]
MKAIEKVIELEIERIRTKQPNDKRIDILNSTLKKINKTRLYSEIQYANNPHALKNCHREIEKTIKTELLDNGKLESPSWKERFVQGLLNALMSFSFGRSSGVSNTGLSFFKSKTQENVEEIYHFLNENKPS